MALLEQRGADPRRRDSHVLAARCCVGFARRRAVPGRRLGGRGIAADAGTDDCRAVDRESYPEHIRAVIFVSLISEAAREELEMLALHGEAALAGISRRGEKDDVTVGEIAATLSAYGYFDLIPRELYCMSVLYR